MSSAQLFSEGINLMLSGMGFVLVFLMILIWAIELISKLINKFFPEKDNPPVKTPQNNTALSDDVSRLRPVIAAAIAHHRRSKGLN